MVAGADCERLGHGLLLQPVNAWSSLAFLVAGIWIAVRALRAEGRRVELAVYALVVAANALGGMLYHGTRWFGSRWVHDLAILAVLAFIAAFGLGRRLGRPTPWTLRTFAVVLVASGLLLAAFPDAAYGLFVVVGAGAVGSELLEYRHELPALRRVGITARRAARLGVAVAALLGGTAFWIGRGGAPFCNPASAFQWHAIWHMLAALAMALFAYGAIEPHPAAIIARPAA